MKKLRSTYLTHFINVLKIETPVTQRVGDVYILNPFKNKQYVYNHKIDFYHKVILIKYVI